MTDLLAQEFERYFTERGYQYGASEKQNAWGWYKNGYDFAVTELARLSAPVEDADLRTTIKRLRQWASPKQELEHGPFIQPCGHELIADAADLIERLARELAAANARIGLLEH
jgi:hypothetical protein